MTGLSEIIAQFLEQDPAASNDEIATKVVESELSREALVSLVAARVAVHRRNDTRAAERKVFVNSVTSHNYTPITETEHREFAESFRKKLSEKTFSLGDGQRVSWGEATVKDHQERITFLERHAAGLHRTADQHREAIKRIEGAGVTCLAELPEEDLGDDLVEGPEVTD